MFELCDGEVPGSFVGLVGNAVGVVFAGAADFDVAADNVGDGVGLEEVHEALHACEPEVPEADVAAAAVEHVSGEEGLGIGVVVGALGDDVPGATPDEDVAAAEVEGDALFGIVCHSPEADHLFVGEAHIAGIWAVDELIKGGEGSAWRWLKASRSSISSSCGHDVYTTSRSSRR